MSTTLGDLLVALQNAISSYGLDKEIDLYNAAGDQHTNPIKIYPKNDDTVEIV